MDDVSIEIKVEPDLDVIEHGLHVKTEERDGRCERTTIDIKTEGELDATDDAERRLAEPEHVYIVDNVDCMPISYDYGLGQRPTVHKGEATLTYRTDGGTVRDLLSEPFAARDAQAKNALLKLRRPTPRIDASQNVTIKGNSFTRHFQESIYAKFKWMCGCPTQNRLYCWPCLLFVVNDKERNVWVAHGYNDLSHLLEAGRKHEKTQSHIKCEIAYKTYDGTKRNDTTTTTTEKRQRLSTVKHNEQVKKNRNVLKRLIDATCYLTRRDDMRGDYTELLSLIGRYDELLANHPLDSTVFTSSTIERDVIVAIRRTIRLRIEKEVHDAPFVAVMLDESSDRTHESKLSVTLRYVVESGVAVERFVSFHDLSADRSGDVLSRLVVRTASDWRCDKKLVAQTYDGATVAADQLGVAQSKVKETHPEATFVHRTGHALNTVLAQSVRHVHGCKSLFATVAGIAAYFSDLCGRNGLDAAALRCPDELRTEWDCPSGAVRVVKTKRRSLRDYFERVVEHAERYDNETINAARGYVAFFVDFVDQFLLNVFSTVFVQTEAISESLRVPRLDTKRCVRTIDEATITIGTMRSVAAFDAAYDETVALVGPPSTASRKRPHDADATDTTKAQLRKSYDEIIKTICHQLDVRFEQVASLKFFRLLDFAHVDDYQKTFPDDCLNALKQSYGKHFDTVKLRNELQVLYRTDSLVKTTLTELMRTIKERDLNDTLSETNRLAHLICTVPFTIGAVHTSSSTLQRIRAYVRSGAERTGSNDVALIVIEKELLEYLQSKEDFYDKVIEQFVDGSDKRSELCYA